MFSIFFPSIIWPLNYTWFSDFCHDFSLRIWHSNVVFFLSSLGTLLSISIPSVAFVTFVIDQISAYLQFFSLCTYDFMVYFYQLWMMKIDSINLDMKIFFLENIICFQWDRCRYKITIHLCCTYINTDLSYVSGMLAEVSFFVEEALGSVTWVHPW